MSFIGIENEFEVVSQFRQGDERAFNNIYDTYKQHLFLFARRYVEHTAEAEDIIADAFIQLWARKGDFEKLGAIIVFLQKTIKNRCLNYLKHQQVKHQRQPELIRIIENTPDSDLSAEMIRLEVLKKIYAEVDKLPARVREVFFLSYRDGLKPAEIAERLNLSVQTVKNQRATAVSLLKSTFNNNPLILSFLAVLEMQFLRWH